MSTVVSNYLAQDLAHNLAHFHRLAHASIYSNRPLLAVNGLFLWF